VLDLDGVVWLADEPIPGSSRAVSLLRDAGIRVLFATNNAAPTVGRILERLAKAGISAVADDVVTSAQAAASMVDAGSTAVVCGEEGLIEALGERGVHVVPEGPSDAVFVGWTKKFDFAMLATAATAVREGGRLIGTNEDATFPTPDRLLPGCGALLAAVSTAAQAKPEVAGKPHAPMATLLKRRASDIAMVVGDRPSTDGALARSIGVPFGHVRSGVTRDGRDPMVVAPDFAAENLAELVDGVLGP
jgi:HAD superfamily hydrolase (TIGR01450 family)